MLRVSGLVGLVGLVLAALCLAAGASPTQQCTLTSASFSEPNWSLEKCTFHRSDTCCSRTEALALYSQMPQIDPYTKKDHKKHWDKCQLYLEELMCFPCASGSSQRSFAPSGWDGDIGVCDRTCRMVWSYCKLFTVQGTPFTDMYPTSNAFCEAQGFRVDIGYYNCYSARGHYDYLDSPAPSALRASFLGSTGVVSVLGVLVALASLAFVRLV